MRQEQVKEMVKRNQMLDCICPHGSLHSATQQLSNSATQQLSNSATQQLSNSASSNCAVKNFSLITFILLSATLTGCSLDASIQSISQDIEQILFQKSAPAEVTPSSSQGVYTNKGYEIQSSVSYYNAKPEAVTTKGYTVETNIQSTLYKER